MTRRTLLIILAALAVGSGTLQHTVAPEQVLVDGAAPRTPTEKETWCPPPPDFPREIMLIAEGACWVEIVATQEKCAALQREGKQAMRYGGRCWWFRHHKPKREPSASGQSSALEVPTNAPKPFKYQVRPGPDGTCGKHARVFNGGCWFRIDVPLDDCLEEERKDMSYFVHEGTCYYALYRLPPAREPTSSAEHHLPKHATR